MNKIAFNGIIYLINDIDKTASVIDYDQLSDEIIIPSYITFKSYKFPVTKISKKAFFKCDSIKSIKFDTDSKIDTFDEYAFRSSSIESISIPPSLININCGWCMHTQNLNKIIVDENNPYFKINDDKYLLKKSSIESDDYDILALCFIKDIKYAQLPSFIRIIGSYAFYGCYQLREIEIPNDSKLEILGTEAFTETLIESFRIPSSLLEIGEGAFCSCNHLRRIEMPKDSKLKEIKLCAFFDTSIECIEIPSSLTKLDDEWCSCTPKMNQIKVDEKNPYFKAYDDKFILKKSSIESEFFDSLIFCVRNIKIATIPNFIKTIGPYAFNTCQLKQINIPKDSKLEIFGKYSLSHSTIEEFTIPSKLIDIQQGWCYNSNNIKRINVDENNPYFKLYENKFIFKKSSIESNTYDILFYCFTRTKTVIIPNFIRIIEQFAFSNCKIQNIEFEKDSKLQIIYKRAFKSSRIRKFSLPSSVTKLYDGCFHYCEQLEKFEIPNDSKLQIIDKYIFCGTCITSITIPSQVTEIGKNIFEQCAKLQIIEIFDITKLNHFDQSLFLDCTQAIYMIHVNANDCSNLRNLNK